MRAQALSQLEGRTSVCPIALLHPSSKLCTHHTRIVQIFETARIQAVSSLNSWEDSDLTGPTPGQTKRSIPPPFISRRVVPSRSHIAQSSSLSSCSHPRLTAVPGANVSVRMHAILNHILTLFVAHFTSLGAYSLSRVPRRYIAVQPWVHVMQLSICLHGIVEQRNERSAAVCLVYGLFLPEDYLRSIQSAYLWCDLIAVIHRHGGLISASPSRGEKCRVAEGRCNRQQSPRTLLGIETRRSLQNLKDCPVRIHYLRPWIAPGWCTIINRGLCLAK